jgi:exonuclease III
MVLKISTLNLCLGLPNKKNLVKQLLISENIDILCLQETELKINIDHSLMSFNDYTFESETNKVKSRTGMYIKLGTKYLRRLDLEGVNSHMVVIDYKSNPGLRVITLYRSFNPPNQLQPRDFFKYQLKLLKQATHSNTLILGDFNLDWSRKGVHVYQFRNYFLDMDNILAESNLVQLVNFNTWCRIINTQVRESLIDHVYSSNPASILKVDGFKPVYGDHTMVNISVELNRPVPATYYRRDWKRYNKVTLCGMLADVDWNIQDDSVQSYWNTFENKLVEVVDNIAPLSTFTHGSHVKVNIPPRIKKRINQRKRLLRNFRRTKDARTKIQLDMVDKEVKQFFNRQRVNNLRKLIVPGNTKSLWKAVNMAKDTCNNIMPKTLFENGVEIDQDKVADVFGSFFDRKVRTVLAEVRINDGVHNGRRMVDAADKMFMREEDVWKCMRTLKA